MKNHTSKSNKNGLTFYKSGKNIRWRIYTSGVVTHASTEGYSRIAGAKANVLSFLRTLGYDVQSQFTPGKNTVEAAIAEFKAKK